MLRRFSMNYALLSVVLDVGLTLASLQLAALIRPHLPPLPWMIQIEVANLPAILYLLVPGIWLIVLPLLSVYDPRRIYRVVDELQTLTLGIGFATLVCMGVLYIAFRDVSRWLFVIFVLLDVFFLFGWRFAMRYIFRLLKSLPPERRILLVGAGQVGQKVAKMIQENKANGLQFVGYLDENRSIENSLAEMPLLGGVRDVRAVVERERVDDVIIAVPHHAYREMGQLIHDLHDLPVNVRAVPDYFSLALYRATAEEFAGVPMINLRDPALNDVQRVIKRMVDLSLGSLLFLIASPLMLAVICAIRLDSPGAVLFRQKRVGENGRIFGMYKFRSMVHGADELIHTVTQRDKQGNMVFKFKDDPRVTRIGRFLRRTSLDELPQLINVLRGEMSLVGPRPELPWLVQEYEPWQMKRFAVPQGITGWWQVNGRSDKPMHLNTEDDLYYVQNYSLWMDIYILFKTPWVVLRGKGAY